MADGWMESSSSLVSSCGISVDPAAASLAERVERERLKRELLGSAEPVRFGRFELIARLGAGAMGTVFEAFDPELERRVAVKLLHGHLRDSTEARARLRREARALARLSHENIVRVFESGEAEGRLFLVMELVAGETLRSWLEHAPTVRARLDVFVQAGRALAEAHRNGIVHRDFKPENVLIDRCGSVRVVDFGVARLIDLATREGGAGPIYVTSQGTDHVPTSPLGTPRYMAPEQQAGAEADARSDQYSFCLAFYEAMFGKRTEPDGEPARARPGRALERVLLRGLDPVPARRWSDMDALLRAIGRARRRRIVALAVVTVSLATGVPAAFALAHDARCARQAHQALQTWSERDVPAVSAGLAAVDRAFAREAAITAVPRLTDYVRDLTEIDADICRADFGTGGPRDVVHSCLQSRHAGLEQLVTWLVAADEGVATAAIQVILNLPDPTRCVDPSAAELEFADNFDPAFERELAAVRISHALGRYPDSRDRGAALIEQARESGRIRDVARALLSQGWTLGELGALEPARQHMEEAFFMALEHGYQRQVAGAAVGLAVWLKTSDPVWTRHWGAVARALDDRVPLELQQLLDVESSLAAIATTDGEKLEALQRLQALLPRIEAHSPAHLALSHGSLGFAFDRMGRLDDAEIHMRASFELAVERLGPWHPRTGDAALNLSSVLRKRGTPEDAVAMAQQAIAIYESALPAVHRDIALAHLNLGASFADLWRHADADREHERAIDILTAIGRDDPALGLAYSNLAETALRSGRPGLARLRSERGLELYEAVYSDVHPELLAPLTVVIQSQAAVGDHAATRRSVERFLLVLAQMGDDAEPESAEWAWRSAALAHHAEGQFEAATSAYERALEHSRRFRAPDDPALRELLLGAARARDAAQP